MARAPDKRIEQAKELFAVGNLLTDGITSVRIKKANVRIRKKEAVNREIKMRPVRREIRMQLRQESLKLSFLIVWIQKKNG